MKVAKKAAVACIVAAIAVLSGVTFWDLPPQSTHAASPELSIPGIPTDREPERYIGSFLDTSVTAMLARLGVGVAPQDKVYAFPDPALGAGSTVLVYRAQLVVLNDAGTVREVRTWATTLEGLAEEQNLELAEKDKTVTGGNATRLASIPVQPEPVEVTITRVAEAEVPVTTAIPYTTRYVDDPNVEKGITSVEQAGKKGSLKTVYLVRRENGKEVSRKTLSTERLSEPVQEVIRRGTKIVKLDEGLGTFYSIAGRQCGTGRMTAAHKTLPKGTQVRVVNKANGKSVVVTIDDRGPYGAGRVIDLSCDAFASIASLGTGVISVKVEKP